MKDYSNSFITHLWHEAQQRLHYADEVIFVGYSMPDADIVLRMFFTRAIYANKLIRGKRCQIRVVDFVKPECRSSIEPTDVQQRYMQLFGEIDYDFTGFEEFIKRDCQTENEANCN